MGRALGEGSDTRDRSPRDKLVGRMPGSSTAPILEQRGGNNMAYMSRYHVVVPRYVRVLFLGVGTSFRNM